MFIKFWILYLIESFNLKMMYKDKNGKLYLEEDVNKLDAIQIEDLNLHVIDKLESEV